MRRETPVFLKTIRHCLRTLLSVGDDYPDSRTWVQNPLGQFKVGER